MSTGAVRPKVKVDEPIKDFWPPQPTILLKGRIKISIKLWFILLLIPATVIAQQALAPTNIEKETKPIEAPQETEIEKTIPTTQKAPKAPPVARVKPTPQINNQPIGRNLAEWLLALRKCESGGVYTRNSGNGYFGAYQFLPSTWNRVAPKLGRPDLVGIRPDLATPADQDFMVIGNARISAGLVSQHPGCYRKLGLSNKPPQE